MLRSRSGSNSGRLRKGEDAVSSSPGSAGRTVISTSRLRLREYVPADVDERAAMFADKQTMRYYPRIKSRDETVGWIEWNLGSYGKHGFGLWVVELKSTGEFLGECGLVVQEVDGSREIELGYSIKRSHWGKGFAPEASIAVRDHAFEFLGLRRLISIIHPDNTRSQAVARKVGMRHEKDTQLFGLPQQIYSLDASPHRTTAPAHDLDGR
jgi:RimJ/RimL family protein N-acetyltransferase